MRRGLQNALDEYLILLAQAGNREAIDRLAARWTPRLLAFAARSTNNTEAAKDVVQETWESALRGMGQLEDPARFPAWIYTIAARKCTDVLRTKYRGQRFTTAMEQHVATEAPTPSDGDAHLDLAAALFYGEDMSVSEIAVITGVPPGTVKSRLSAARHALRKHLEGEHDE